uniref:Uncharacterized protein n=1 Tax=Lygus hesperus TaxID=30085 RepID=A0A0A9XNK5_LYGHE
MMSSANSPVENLYDSYMHDLPSIEYEHGDKLLTEYEHKEKSPSSSPTKVYRATVYNDEISQYVKNKEYREPTIEGMLSDNNTSITNASYYDNVQPHDKLPDIEDKIDITNSMNTEIFDDIQ